MLKHKLIHPEIVEALAAAGHGAKVLIADANYPSSTEFGENSQVVYLNLTPGIPTVTQVLEVLLTAIPIEDAAIMEPDTGTESAACREFRSVLPDVELNGYSRFEFYEEASGPATCLHIVTGDARPYANVLLTIGVAGMT